MKFNIHFGQMREKDGQMYFVPKTPKGKLIMQGMKDGTSDEYVADELGNIEVTTPKHINVMVGLGYPIYNGNGIKPVPRDDLLFPNLHLDSEYWRQINKGLARRNLRWPTFGIKS